MTQNKGPNFDSGAPEVSTPGMTINQPKPEEKPEDKKKASEQKPEASDEAKA